MPVSSWRNRCLQPLVAGADQPRRTAAAFAVGTFLDFSPFLGLQIVTGFTVAFLLRLDRARRCSSASAPTVDHGAVVR